MTLYEETIQELQRVQGGLPITTISFRFHFGEHKSALRGQGHDFYQVREYDPERDSIERINWHRAAELGEELQVRESIETKDFQVVLLVDLSSSIDFGTVTLPKRKLLLECVGILGLSAAHVQDRIGVVGFTDAIVLHEQPRSGADHVYHLLSRLCGFLEGVSPEKRRKTDFENAVDVVERGLKGSCLVVVLSDCIGSEHIAESALLASRNSRHEYLFLILDDPDEFAIKNKRGFLRIENMETGEEARVSLKKLPRLRKEIQARQENFRMNLRKIGIESLVLRYGDHFQTLTEFLAERKEVR